MEAHEEDWKPFDDHAAKLGVHVKTMIRWARHGIRGVTLKHRRLGIRYQTTKAHLDEFFAAGAQAAVPVGATAARATVSPRRQKAARAAARAVLGAD